MALSGQTAQLALANGRVSDSIEIAEACDRRSAEVVAALKPRKRWMGLF